MQPPSFHTERNNQFNTTHTDPYVPTRFFYPGPTYHPRNRSMSTNVPQKPYTQGFSNPQSETYIPSYQKQVHMNPQIQTQYYHQPNIVHRQFNSPISLYSNDNVQEVMNHHVNQVK
jgi:hypothetical protein